MKEESTPLEDMQHKISELEKVQQQTFSVDRFKSRDSDFEFYTGFCNYSTFKASYDYLCPVCERLQYIGSYNTKNKQYNTNSNTTEVWPKAAVIPGHATAEVPECMSCHQVSQSVQAQCSLTTETKGLLHVCNDLQHQQDSRIMQKRDLQKFGPGEHKPGIVFFRI